MRNGASEIVAPSDADWGRSTLAQSHREIRWFVDILSRRAGAAGCTPSHLRITRRCPRTTALHLIEPIPNPAAERNWWPWSERLYDCGTGSMKRTERLAVPGYWNDTWGAARSVSAVS